jgi:hypothetical protein
MTQYPDYLGAAQKLLEQQGEINDLKRQVAELTQRLTDLDLSPGEHVIELRANGWTIQHPLVCRQQPGGLFTCPVNRAAEVNFTQDDLDPGKYAVTAIVDDEVAELVIGRKIE